MYIELNNNKLYVYRIPILYSKKTATSVSITGVYAEPSAGVGKNGRWWRGKEALGMLACMGEGGEVR